MKLIKRLIRPFKKNRREVEIVSSAIKAYDDNAHARKMLIKYIKVNN